MFIIDIRNLGEKKMKKLIAVISILILVVGCNSNVKIEKEHDAKEVFDLLTEAGFELSVYDTTAFMLKEDTDFYIYFGTEESMIINIGENWEHSESSRYGSTLLVRKGEQACLYDFAKDSYGYGEDDADSVAMGMMKIEMGSFDSNDFCPTEADKAIKNYQETLNEMGLNLADIRVFLGEIKVEEVRQFLP